MMALTTLFFVKKKIGSVVEKINLADLLRKRIRVGLLVTLSLGESF